ncbi:transposon Tf2-9 polyprotein [Trichonephila clavipes]|nr:transposon Tf2-9 polyprotein [Trichonephila clavipes]
MYKNALKEDFIRVVQELDGIVESTDTIVKLKTKIENSSTFESDPDFVKTLIQNCIDERVSRNKREVTSGKQKIELAKLQLAQLEKEVELQRVKNKALSLNPAAKFEEKQFKTLNKETATHIGIREAEDWSRPIDLAKECDIYISSRNGSRKEIPITYGYTQDPFKNRSQNFKPKIKENYPQYLERENKNCFICGDSSHCARNCEKRFKPKESNDHILNRINVNTLKIENEKQNSDEFAQQLQYVNIFVENQPVTALIDSGCQIPVLNSSLIRVQTPSEEIITLSSCFGEKRMVEVKPINISLNQHSTSLSVRTAISPTLTEEFIIHPSVYSEIEKLGHAKSDVLLSENESSLGAHAYAYSSAISFPNVSVSNVIENSSYDLPYVKNFNTRNDLSSLIKDYKCNNIKSTKLKMCIKLKNDIPVCQRARRLSCSEKLQVNNQIDDWLRQGIIKESVFDYCSDIVLCKKANGAMKTSSVEFISRSPTPSPMEHSPLVSMEIPLRTAYGQAGRCGMQPKPSSLRAQAHQSKSRTETCELVKVKQKLLNIRAERKENARGKALELSFTTGSPQAHFCRLPKWEAKTRHGVSFVPSLLRTLEEDLQQQPVDQDSPKDSLSDLSLEIELTIPFAPNQDPQDIPQQLQLGEIVHYHPSERSHYQLHRHTGGHMDQGSHPDIPHQSEFFPGTHAGQCDHQVRSLPKPLFHHLGNGVFQQCWIDDI